MYSMSGLPQHDMNNSKRMTHTPAHPVRQYAVMSCSGNTWRKLCYVLDLWGPHLSVLMSVYDIYVADRSIREEILSVGIREHLSRALKRTSRYLASKNGDYRRYRERVEQLLEEPPEITGPIAIDSGGFSFSNRKRISRLAGISDAPDIASLGRLLLELDVLEAEEGSTERYLDLAKEAARINIRHQLMAGADLVVSLDRVFDFRLPFRERELRWQLSLVSAREALQTAVGNPSDHPWPSEGDDGALSVHHNPGIIPVIHPLGPVPAKGAQPQDFYRFASEAVRYLERAEQDLGCRFAGVAVGSLVPLTREEVLLPVAQGIGKAILESSFRDRVVHAFGASNNKMELLWECGFNSFDTSHHLIKGRNRQSYVPKLV